MSTDNIFNKNLRLVFLLIISAEILSFLGYYWQMINFLTFFAVTILALIISLRRLEYGLYILLAELFIGSFGYLFYFETGGLKISLRLALWLIIMSVWLAKTAVSWAKTKQLNVAFLKSNYFNYFFVLFIFISWGVVNGFFNGNSLSNIFFDFNQWLYFLLIFPIFQILMDENNLKILKQIFLAGIIWLSFKTILLAYFFSHNFSYFALDLYRWVRLSGLGEITQVQGGFYRVFMQSQIFILIGFFILAIVIARSASERGSLPRIKCGVGTGSAISRTSSVHQIAILHSVARNNKKKVFIASFLLSLFLSTIVISFSRSFWLGLLAGGISVWFIIIFKLRIRLKQFIVFNSIILLAAFLSLVLALAIVFFPYPAPLGGFNTTALLSDRATGLTGEAGASSRWQLLPPLWQKIKQAPVMGQGFGATVTYKTSDPRILKTNPGGIYTTYAFEWGWLDVWLKLGILGLLAYLILFAKIIFTGLKINTTLSLSLVCGLIVLAAVNIFSPYVNHPLGIGYLMIAAAMLEQLSLRGAPANADPSPASSAGSGQASQSHELLT